MSSIEANKEIQSLLVEIIQPPPNTEQKRALETKIEAIVKFYDEQDAWSDQVSFFRKVQTVAPLSLDMATHFARSLMLFGAYEEAHAVLQRAVPKDGSCQLLANLCEIIERADSQNLILKATNNPDFVKQVKKPSSALVYYSKASQPEELEKIACMVERMSKVWQATTEGLDETIEPAVKLNHMTFTKLTRFATDYTLLLQPFVQTHQNEVLDTPFAALAKLGQRAARLSEKILAACKEHYKTGDMAFLNFARWKQLDLSQEELPCHKRLFIQAITTLFGPAGHPFLIDKQREALCRSEVGIDRYRSSRVSLFSLLVTDSFRVNFDKLLTEEAQKFLQELALFVQQRTRQNVSTNDLRQKVEELYRKELEELLHPDAQALEIDRRLTEIFKGNNASAYVPKLQSLWNSAFICCYAGVKAFFPYRISQKPQEVVLDGGMICSEFAIKATHHALRKTEKAMNQYLKIWISGLRIPGNLPETDVDRIKLFHPIIPPHIDMHRMIPANVLRYAKPYLTYVEKPEILQKLVEMPQEVLLTTLI